jgi:hypothetical protein
MMNPSIVVFLDATGGDVRKIILERLVRPHVPMLQERKSKEILEAPPGFDRGWRFCRAIPGCFARSKYQTIPEKLHLQGRTQEPQERPPDNRG